MKKAVPIGYEDIKEMIDKNLYYIDKTMMIRDLLDSGAKVSMFTRPRRFCQNASRSITGRMPSSSSMSMTCHWKMRISKNFMKR